MSVRCWGRAPQIVVLASLLCVVTGEFMRQQQRPSGYLTEAGEFVCPSMDIRNDPSYLHQLTNCTVIEGYLQILLIDHAETSQYQDLHFPALREITDFLLLYRVYGLINLTHIFPNLAVIRGQNLFYNYALVAFEMPDLEELGLVGLTRIERGAVRLEKNPHLCYIDTINWDYITTLGNDDNIIMQNKVIDECPNVCPAGDQCQSVLQDSGYRQPLCWNADSCQKVCPDECVRHDLPCYTERNQRGVPVTRCCHEECVGGCSGPHATDCFACKHVFYKGDSNKGRCMQKCLPETYKFLNRRCVTDIECQNMATEYPNTWKVFDHSMEQLCIQDCPSGFIKDKDKPHRCIKCEGPCPKRCGGITIDSVAAAQKLKGCTVIHGILEIQIRGGSAGHIGRELEENLSQLEEVTHYVKIVRSYASVSLRFLKNLKVIRGDRLHNDRYAMFVLDNQNLVDIWNFTTHPKLKIERGRIFFMFNRKLCLEKIQQLVKFVGLENVTTDEDVDPNTNGDQVACDTSHLTLELVVGQAEYAVIRWNNFHTADHRELLSWVVYYREAPEQNITIFNARDACGMDGWKTDDVNPDVDTNATYVATILYNLKPATQYAVYVQTYTVATANRGAISSIVYFTTAPAMPTPARDIKLQAKKVGELLVTWKPPSKPNGNVTHYYIYWQPQPLSIEKFDRRNYCIDKLRLPTEKKTNIVPAKNRTLSGDCCACPKTEEEQRMEEDERLLQIEFENFLQNAVYLKRPLIGGTAPNMGNEEEEEEEEKEDSSGGERMKRYAVDRRYRKDLYKRLEEMPTYNNSLYSILQGNFSWDLNMTDFNASGEESEDVLYESAVVYGKLEVTLTGLKHFQEYSVEVIACHDLQDGRTEKLCSNRAITTARTLPARHADDIVVQNISVVNYTAPETRRIYIKWHDPPTPNGIIITYDVEMQRTEIANYKPDVFCIPHVKYRNDSGYITEPLTPGNWSYRIRAMSLAGNGSWTPTRFFYVTHFTHEGAVPLGLALGLPIAVILVVAIVATSVGVVYYVKKKNELPDALMYTSVNPEYWSGTEVYVADDWEVPRENIKLLKELGQGSFGMVYEGIATGLVEGEDVVKVAVKTVNEKASVRDRIEFLNEASVMKAFQCRHVVRLLGVVSKGQPTLVVMELMANGDLKSYLRLHRPDYEDNDGRKPPSLKQILQMAGEIADGMAYLACKKYVHRDLAARNCMVSEAEVVKIGDFGMTRDIYETDYYRKGGKGLLPVRWMSPESLKDGIFTSQSDVWSYGVVIWEMATLAAQPYQGLHNEQVLNYVIGGGIMDKPEGCPDKLYELMSDCWQHSPKQRPTFCEIIEMLVPDLSVDFKHTSFFFSDEKEAAVAKAAAREELEEELEAVDVHTPLTGSPLHQPHDRGSFGDAGDGGFPDDYSAAGHDEGVEVEDGDSVGSSLSYQSPTPPTDNRSREPTADYRPYHEMGDGVNGELVKSKEDKRRAFFRNIGSAPGGEPPPVVTYSNEGSKESSGSSCNGGGKNGLANGHIPLNHYPHSATAGRAEC